MKLLTDLRTLQSFVSVAHEGNVSRAAEHLNLTQPAVSLQLKRLSEDTGLTLFRRTAKGVELTRDGEAMLAKAERVLAAMRELEQTARRMTGTVRGALRIGTIVDPDFIRLGAFLAGLLEAAPDLHAELIHGVSGDVPVRLQRGAIDVGYFLEDPEHAGSMAEDGTGDGGPRFRYRPLTRFNYRVIAPAGWERRVAGLGWAELAVLPWIGTPEASVHQRLLQRRFQRDHAVQNQVALVDQESSMLAMAQSGVGLCLCRESTALHEKQANGIVVVEGAKIETELGFLALEARSQEPCIALAFEVLGRIWSAAL